MLTIALSKGKLLEPTLKLFARAGYTSEDLSLDSRRLVFLCPDQDMMLLIVRPSDVPTYVEYGAADAGVVGKDMLLEQNRDVYEPMDLKFGACRIAVAARRGQELRDRLSSKIRVATKYPHIAERYFNQKGVPVEIIKLYGSIELAPVVGLADGIVDLVSTGNTLKAHDLVETETIAESTARLIVNRASLKMKHASLTEMMTRLRNGQAGTRGGGDAPIRAGRQAGRRGRTESQPARAGGRKAVGGRL
jgi:ATP phosphoribosyltransferase